LSMHHVVRGPHYRARPNPATPVRRVPFRCSDIRRNISHTEASYVAADPLSIDHRTVPKPVVAHRTFHGKFAGVPVYDPENELALLHRSTPETEVCFPSRRHPCGAARGPVSGRLFFKSVASTSSGSAQSRDGGPLFVVNVELKHRFVTSDVEFDVMYRSSFVITAPLDEGYQC
jgi:hypothetical protein